MVDVEITSYDGIVLHCAHTAIQPDKPWIGFIMPFGMKLHMTECFFEFFEPQYNVVAWESRSILESSERNVAEGEFHLSNHIDDLHKVLTSVPAERFHLVGYCSGAGIALAATQKYPELVDKLILVHGEYAMLHHKECTSQFAAEIDSLLSLAAKDEEHLNLVFKKIQGERMDNVSNRPDGVDLPFTELAFLRRHAANYLSYKEQNFESYAESIPHHTFIMTGELDVQANVASSRRIHDLMKNSEIMIDANADHYEILREDSNSMISIWNYLQRWQNSHG